MQFTEKKIALDSISSSGKDKYGQWWKSFSKQYIREIFNQKNFKSDRTILSPNLALNNSR